ncbi:AraC family transcriptional regulator [Archangium lansingense]|uniref:AraC family transcriptional regulator n=1 Tax=Archangium lansingense TaxID=2995310 RepID=A0ABT4A0E0_9BACT|nr:AraC family transcriptional regulator [Archangium lansinium]MCY1075068.1 AraC family transcriptional regulator [Archangium lansinium]
MTQPSIQISARLALPQLVLARRRGLDETALCQEAGLDCSLLREPEARIPLSSFEALMEALASRVKEPTLGLELAREFTLEAYGVSGLVLMASPTLREGFERAFRYQRLWEDFERLTLEPCEGGGSIRFLSHEPRRPIHRVLAECILAELLLTTRALTTMPVRPLWVHFEHEPPPDSSAHEDFFGIPVSFGASTTEIAFSNATLDLPLTHANALFLSFFEQQAKAKVEQLPSTSQLSEQVRTVLRGALGGGDSSLVAVAAKLHMSPRSLQRRLKEEGTRYEALLDGLRRELAKVYLDKRLSIAEVSYLLGYANPTVFHRAFKRWTGQSPEHYRARSAGARPSPQLSD